ncbi:MAG: peptide chain release factor N(5)-glutamine methyltransferase [Propionibacteriaceae bacterium]|nr:peptide chain release factor N(5)-glutamine methyltransferase [Propionibacteriaceae bacterium]
MRPSALVARLAATLGSSAEARTLVAHVLGCEPARLPLAEDPGPDAVAALDALVARRLAGEPLQHLTGRTWFRTVGVEVGPGVFVPRPETEVMTGWALDRLAELPAVPRPRVVELCTGSGAISLALLTEHPGLDLHAVEISEDAAPYLRRNLAGTDAAIVIADMADALTDLDGSVDLVIANPPYVPLAHWADVPGDVRDHDPLVALVSGEDGLDALRVVARVAARLLRPGGRVCAEHAEVQEHSAPEVFVRHGGFVRIVDERDLTGRPRFVTAVRAGRMAP